MPVLWGDGGLRDLSARRALPVERGQLSSWGAVWDHFWGPHGIPQTHVWTVVTGLCLGRASAWSGLPAGIWGTKAGMRMPPAPHPARLPLRQLRNLVQPSWMSPGPWLLRACGSAAGTPASSIPQAGDTGGWHSAGTHVRHPEISTPIKHRSVGPAGLHVLVIFVSKPRESPVVEAGRGEVTCPAGLLSFKRLLCWPF